MEMEIEEHSERLINESAVIKSATINDRECKVYATSGRENNRFSCKALEFEDYQEPQYNGWDQYVCSECNIPKPSARLLDIHLQEIHDSFFKILSERQPMYECYVSECDLKFNNPSERREHCISDHKFSKIFRIVEDRNKIPELKRKSGKLKEDPILCEKTTKPQKRKNVVDLENCKRKTFDSGLISSSCQLDKSKTVLDFIPRQITLQNSYAKVLTNSECLNREILENECMIHLADSLPNNVD